MLLLNHKKWNNGDTHSATNRKKKSLALTTDFDNLQGKKFQITFLSGLKHQLTDQNVFSQTIRSPCLHLQTQTLLSWFPSLLQVKIQGVRCEGEMG